MFEFSGVKYAKSAPVPSLIVSASAKYEATPIIPLTKLVLICVALDAPAPNISTLEIPAAFNAVTSAGSYTISVSTPSPPS